MYAARNNGFSVLSWKIPPLAMVSHDLILGVAVVRGYGDCK